MSAAFRGNHGRRRAGQNVEANLLRHLLTGELVAEFIQKSLMFGARAVQIDVVFLGVLLEIRRQSEDRDSVRGRELFEPMIGIKQVGCPRAIDERLTQGGIGIRLNAAAQRHQQELGAFRYNLIVDLHNQVFGDVPCILPGWAVRCAVESRLEAHAGGGQTFDVALSKVIRAGGDHLQ